MKRRLTILGSTGSIGRQALDVVRSHPDRFEVAALSADRNADLLLQQATEFTPDYLALESGSPDDLSGKAPATTETLTGPGSASRLAEVPADVVLNGVVGFAGLSATVSALRQGNRVALANKESLVTGGEWVMNLAESVDNRIIPVDSEHSAIFQCLEGREKGLSGILLTASGGPFFEFPKERIVEARPEDALQHPTWQMGRKVTIDSATMMNKGLEVIEAHHLFGVAYEDITVTVHRQSVVHGGALFEDGSAILHAALPDMRLPIAYGILFPERVDVGAEPVGFGSAAWTFDEPRSEIFRGLPLAVEAGKAGGVYPVALNAANEVAVEAFLDERIKFLQITDLIEEVLAGVTESETPESMEAIVAADHEARERATKRVEGFEVR